MRFGKSKQREFGTFFANEEGITVDSLTFVLFSFVVEIIDISALINLCYLEHRNAYNFTKFNGPLQFLYHSIFKSW